MVFADELVKLGITEGVRGVGFIFRILIVRFNIVYSNGYFI